MKLFLELTVDEKKALVFLTPTHTESYLSVWTEEGLYEVRNKIHKQCLIDEKDTVVGDYNGRKYWIEDTTLALKEMWQIPLPNHTVKKTVNTYNISGTEMCCIIEYDTNTTYFFTGATVQKAIEWLKTLQNQYNYGKC